MKNYSSKLTAILTITLMFIGALLYGQDTGFIYGKVTTIDNKVFEGPLRWGKEEVFWTDMFNTSALENKNLKYLSNDERDELEDRYNSRNGIGTWFESFVINFTDNEEERHTHQFVCEFGNLKSIKPMSRNRITIQTQNGDEFELSGDGYNDVGEDIKIIDPEIGEIKIDWGRIEMVEFMSGPNQLKEKFGEPLYGTVNTYRGKFTGTIQWDHDERLSTDQLDGDTDDGDMSIDFGNIRSIERDGSRSSRVELKSGRMLDLDGSNDVNSENRGIIVTTEFGRVDIPWREFKRVEFTDKATMALKSYNSYKTQKQLVGKVVSKKGKSYAGRIVFDLDEANDYDVLHGTDNDVQFLIAFKNIKKIAPKNYEFSNLELKSGEKLMLGEDQDVSDKNSGLLVFEDSKSIYIPWEDIEEVIFE